MTRKEKREQSKNTNEFKELMKIIKHFFKDFLKKLKDVNDPRHESYIQYKTDEILLTILLGYIMHIGSMRNMTEQFNKEECVCNIQTILQNNNIAEIPHYDTINNFLEQVDILEIEKIVKYMVSELIKKKSFNHLRYMSEYWLIAVDATHLYSFKKRHCEHCLKKEITTNKKTGEKTTIYYHNVLEAKLILGDMAISIGTEFVENEHEDVTKQDCERKAFYRLAKKLKNEYKRLKICILGDSLYACKPVFDICKKNKWEYIIRFKEGSIKTVAEEFNILKEIEENSTNTFEEIKVKKKIEQKYKWINGIDYNEHKLNILEVEETTEKNKTTFVFISSIIIKTKKIARMIGETGRMRWKIENEGFNIQKTKGYNLEHIYSKNYNAMKCHYLILQIAHTIRQLFEKGIKIVKQHKMTLKKISSNLLECFRRQILTETDILEIEKRKQIRFLQ